ncbi:MAG: type I-B CRISPR-associated protein Cas7/Cst2/DevR [Hydrotalea flava]|nr:type I-B CRISPR-associated protein Cas7/Cst2/DevR [Hydrotalea flava]NIM39350.1 type I-B CRISPR-associated protein Cas7/Cst2/DevR [Hydrotalea flava]NIN04539.1 type I-B CRISPR-associated protein Cas7/Cst2/DevR [Hydrotalea flava]NIN16211.1 type I-B CRISPR-associated protein Cas7/Cst2/DevR [Hydrotalea flava]NIO95276.1 type I-B CRISPR-associated protein Cas7/Cst2/DevR [Hydrotalea flava]
MAELKNITGALLIDASAAFLNGAGLGTGEDKNKVIPKTFREKVNNRVEEVPYVSAQSWRRWLRDTSNEENGWNPSELRAIGKSEGKESTNKIATELNPIDFPEDDLFGYMKSGAKGEESIQRTSPFKSSILKGIRNMRTLNNDEAFVHLKEGTPLPYSTRFYSTHLEGFFNLEYYRLGVYENLGSHQELSKELVEQHQDKFEISDLNGSKFKRYKLKDAQKIRNKNASGLLKGLAFLRGGAKQSAFGSDVSPKVLILAGMESANPVFNNIFIGTGEKPALNIEVVKQIASDYSSKLATPVYIGIRAGYLQNEEDVKALGESFVIDSPIGIVNNFTEKYLK